MELHEPENEHSLPVDLPAIPYSLRSRKISIAIVWTIILLDSVVLPLGLFFILKYGVGWDDIKNLAISNGVFGFFAFIQYAFRLYRLLRTSPEYRPLGSGRWALDFYQYQFTIGFVGVTLLLSFTTGPENLRLISLAPSILPAQCGPQFLFSCLCYHQRWRIPVNFSSTQKGSIAPPAVFTVVEDVLAVDGGGGRTFRTAWIQRYQVSEMYREMMYKLTMFWGWGCMLCVGVNAAVVFTVKSKYVAFGFGWTAPFVWAGIWAAITTVWVQRMLSKEKKEWVEMRNRVRIEPKSD
jgi:hypothetical protein